MKQLSHKAKFMQELQQSFREVKEGKTRPVECLINELENTCLYDKSELRNITKQ